MKCDALTYSRSIPAYGLYTDSNGNTQYHEYRYVGANPNNYVWFNNDMYRIIGIFDGYSHGVGVTYDENDNTVVTSYGDYLIKLIMADTLVSSS